MGFTLFLLANDRQKAFTVSFPHWNLFLTDKDTFFIDACDLTLLDDIGAVDAHKPFPEKILLQRLEAES